MKKKHLHTVINIFSAVCGGMEVNMKYTQQNAPIHEALLQHKKNRIVPFDVPGHKGGRGTPELTEFLGSDC